MSHIQYGKLNQSFISSSTLIAQMDTFIASRFQKNIEPIKVKVVRMILIMFGAIWGIPWLQSASDCITAIGIQSKLVHVLAQIGIIVAVGIDGVWIMITVCDIMFTNIKTKLYLREVYKKQSIIFGISLVVGLISCIPGVYASYLFNNGKQRYYSIITFAGNLGLATFGFYSLTFQIFRKILQKNEQTTQYPQKIYSNFLKVIQNQNDENQSIIPRDIVIYKDYEGYIIQEAKNLNKFIQKWKNQILFVVPLIFAIIVAFSQSLIDIVLTTKFFTRQLQFNRVISIILSSIFTIPGLIVSLFSARQVMQKILIIIFSLPSLKYNFLDHFCRKYAFGISVIALLVSITSPTSACYITYYTISVQIQVELAWLATLTILIARFCFSNYTCRVLLSKIYIMRVRQKKERILEQENLNKIFVLMDRVNRKYFKEL